MTTHLLHPPFHHFSANVLTVPIFINDKIKCSPSRKINKVVTKARREISRQEQIYIHIFIVVSLLDETFSRVRKFFPIPHWLCEARFLVSQSIWKTQHPYENKSTVISVIPPTGAYFLRHL